MEVSSQSTSKVFIVLEASEGRGGCIPSTIPAAQKLSLFTHGAGRGALRGFSWVGPNSSQRAWGPRASVPPTQISQPYPQHSRFAPSWETVPDPELTSLPQSGVPCTVNSIHLEIVKISSERGRCLALH